VLIGKWRADHAAKLTQDRFRSIFGSIPEKMEVCDYTFQPMDREKDIRREEFAEGAKFTSLNRWDGRAFLDNWKKHGGWWVSGIGVLVQ